MTADRRAGRQRSLRTGRRGLVALGAALTVLTLGVAPASAESFLDPQNPCTEPVGPAPFTDRDTISAVHVLNVDCAFAEGIVLGRADNRFMPAASMPRDQMASLIARTLTAGGYTLPAPQATPFNDVAADNPHRDAISQLFQAGIVKGKDADTYSPGEPVRRDQMASFMVRAAEFAYGDPGSPDMLAGNAGNEFDPYVPFVDVPATNVHAANIAAADDLIGVTAGKTENTYDPGSDVSREQMATFAVRLLDVTALPDSTLD